MVLRARFGAHFLDNLPLPNLPLFPDVSGNAVITLAGDTITINSLGTFAADLLIYGKQAGAPAIEPDPGRDTVTFSGNSRARGQRSAGSTAATTPLMRVSPVAMRHR